MSLISFRYHRKNRYQTIPLSLQYKSARSFFALPRQLAYLPHGEMLQRRHAPHFKSLRNVHRQFKVLSLYGLQESPKYRKEVFAFRAALSNATSVVCCNSFFWHSSCSTSYFDRFRPHSNAILFKSFSSFSFLSSPPAPYTHSRTLLVTHSLHKPFSALLLSSRTTPCILPFAVPVCLIPHSFCLLRSPSQQQAISHFSFIIPHFVTSKKSLFCPPTMSRSPWFL